MAWIPRPFALEGWRDETHFARPDDVLDIGLWESLVDRQVVVACGLEAGYPSAAAIDWRLVTCHVCRRVYNASHPLETSD